MQAQSTKSDQVIEFFAKLRKAFHYRKTTKIYIVLDNARAHHTNDVKQFCQKNNIELVFQPPYSPEFNCIESLWGVIKRDFKYRLAERKYDKLV